MEEHAEGRCSVVYYCGGLEHDVSELYHSTSPPEIPPNSDKLSPLDVVYRNVQALLDKDQGGLDEGRTQPLAPLRYARHMLTTVSSLRQLKCCQMPRSSGKLCELGSYGCSRGAH
jgi:hypothetical protein